MKTLILGSGGRESALAWKISKSPYSEELFIAPGNGGTAQYGTNISMKEMDFEEIGTFCEEKCINLVIVGPEAPLVGGIRAFFQAHPTLKNIRIIGPGSDGAALEGSKDFAKSFMQKHEIPTAKYQTISAENLEEGKNFLRSLKPPYVLKADGLAGGKGVLILHDLEEAERSLEEMIVGAAFGEASKRVVIEEFLDGIECSVFALTDGKEYLLLPDAKDYKRIGEGDTGLNTGGMGAVSPVPFIDRELGEKIEEQIVQRTIEGLKKDHIPFLGFLFFGLMIVNGNPYVIEYNVRLGDPETEVILPRISSDLLVHLIECTDGILGETPLEISHETATTVMCVSEGYPESYSKGNTMTVEEIQSKKHLFLHAGTTLKDGVLTTSGGRVIACTGLGDSIENALEKSYDMVDAITYKGKTYRKDIGQDLM